MNSLESRIKIYIFNKISRFIDLCFFILIKVYREKLNNLFLPIKVVGFFLIIQIFLGILTLIYGAQIYLASMHQLSSIFLVSSSVYLLYLNSNQQLLS